MLHEFEMKYITRGSNNNMPDIIQIMAWRWTGDEPLSEPMMALFTDSSLHLSASMSYSLYLSNMWIRHMCKVHFHLWKVIWALWSGPDCYLFDTYLEKTISICLSDRVHKLLWWLWIHCLKGLFRSPILFHCINIWCLKGCIFLSSIKTQSFQMLKIKLSSQMDSDTNALWSWHFLSW